MKETDLSEPVSRWLKELGYKVWTEIPVLGRNIDIVARKHRDDIICVELKLRFTNSLFHQAYTCQLVTDHVYMIAATNPRKITLERAEKYGLGVASCIDGKVTVIREPKSTKKRDRINAIYKRVVNDRLDFFDEGGVAGSSGRDFEGSGPAQEVYKKIERIREGNPKITWKELFELIPNHYASMTSMRSSMYKARDRVLKKRSRAKVVCDRIQKAVNFTIET